MMNTLGVDISTWQDSPLITGHIKFDVMKLEGVEFVFVKSSQAAFTDPDFPLNWQAAKAAGLLRGAYHYFDWSKPALEQARYFSALLKDDPGELPPVVDYECRKNVPSAGTARLALRTFLEEFKRLSGRTPILYTSPGYWAEFGSADGYWLQYSLWIAHYYVSKPTVPKPWTGWTFWQYTDKGDGLAYGVETKQLDMNVFDGNVDSLHQFAGVTIPLIPPPPKDWRWSVTDFLQGLGYCGPNPE